MTAVEAQRPLRERFGGLLLGTAIGDALGLPAEGLSPEMIRRRWKGCWRMRFCFGRGMVSDDTEHTLMVSQCLLLHGNDVRAFQRALAWKMRWWFLALPAGVGFATAKACLKLWCGVPLAQSGVHSAGNGPAMRAAVIGAFFPTNSGKRKDFVQAATRLTHTDPRAEFAARTIAEAAAWIVRGEAPEDFLSEMAAFGCGEEWLSLCRGIADAHAAKLGVTAFARSLGLSRGVSGYALHTLPVALYAWLRHPDDFETALTSALDCGGDTDTVGAIVGALAGANVGKAGIPVRWLKRIVEWPRSIGIMEVFAECLATASFTERSIEPPHFFWPAVMPRNMFFLAIVLTHGFRRLLPPYSMK